MYEHRLENWKHLVGTLSKEGRQRIKKQEENPIAVYFIDGDNLASFTIVISYRGLQWVSDGNFVFGDDFVFENGEAVSSDEIYAALENLNYKLAEMVRVYLE